jgi:lipopolysaccharide/colanic/teichoic acid biosynthesis glycosyltransferase
MKKLNDNAKPRIAFVVTSHVSWVFFEGQIRFLRGEGFDLCAVSGPGPRLDDVAAEGAHTAAIPMQREIAPFADMGSLCRLVRLFRNRRVDLVVTGTPKAGLLGTLAARITGVPHVVYMVHGLRLETATGWKRRILWFTEWIACHAAHHVRCVSPSLQERLVSLGLAPAKHCIVRGPGTANGVHSEHFQRNSGTPSAAEVLRRTLGIHENALVVGFAGRLTRDKGIADLYQSFVRVRSQYPDARLLLVGDFEDGDPVSPAIRQQIESDSAVVVTGFVADVAPYYWAMDLFVLPSHREGFGIVALEAQAASLPVICSNATGAIDAVVDGVTGITVPVGDIDALTAAISRLLGSEELRQRMGEAGRSWVEKKFKREKLWEELLADYTALTMTHSKHRTDKFGRLLKRALDLAIAVPFSVAALPLWLAIALAIRFNLGSPVLFRQMRPGKHARPFEVVKFRTMSDRRDAKGTLLPDAERLTHLGRFLRATSLDELPQLWNVLRGELSLVGPRPLLMDYLPRYSPEQARRHEVMPGITGWAQVNGRNAVSWEEKFALDVWYVDNWSLWLDFKILWLTAAKVVRRDGISQDGQATMTEFTGNGEFN